MTGRVTMQGMARWAGTGGSDRTGQRFFHTSLSGGKLPWVLMRSPLLAPDDVILRGGAAVVGTKSGQQTHGWDRFFSSLSGQTVPGLGFLRVSRMRVTRRTSSPGLPEHLDQPHRDTPQEVSKKKAQGKRGRPPGSKKQPRRDVGCSHSRRFVQETIKRFLQLIGAHVKGMSGVFAGAFGQHEAPHMVRQLGVHGIATRRYDAALAFPSAGP